MRRHFSLVSAEARGSEQCLGIEPGFERAADVQAFYDRYTPALVQDVCRALKLRLDPQGLLGTTRLGGNEAKMAAHGVRPSALP